MGRFIGIKPEPKAVPVSEVPVTKDTNDTPKKVTKRPARKKAEK